MKKNFETSRSAKNINCMKAYICTIIRTKVTVFTFFFNMETQILLCKILCYKPEAEIFQKRNYQDWSQKLRLVEENKKGISLIQT